MHAVSCLPPPASAAASRTRSAVAWGAVPEGRNARSLTAAHGARVPRKTRTSGQHALPAPRAPRAPRPAGFGGGPCLLLHGHAPCFLGSFSGRTDGHPRGAGPPGAPEAAAGRARRRVDSPGDPDNLDDAPLCRRSSHLTRRCPRGAPCRRATKRRSTSTSYLDVYT